MDFRDFVNTGKSQMVMVLKGLVYRDAPDLFELLDFEEDKAFLEPLVFTYFNYPDKTRMSLKQILWGYIKAARKPSVINVIANNAGVVYLPGYGYMITKYPEKEFSMSFNDGLARLESKGYLVKYEFEPLAWTKGQNIEIVKYPNPLLDNLFTREGSEGLAKVLTLNEGDYPLLIGRALQIIREIDPLYYACLKTTIRKFYCFRGEPNSFASMAAQGIAFFNVQPADGLLFFLDNIIHQCGHVIFNAISFEKEKWFNVPANTQLSTFTLDPKDYQDIYGRFHGLFTQTNINTIFEKCIENKTLQGEEHYELLGRFASNLTRFGVAIKKLDHPGMYTEVGLFWYNFFKMSHSVLNVKWESVINQYRVDNQPYVFNYKKFKESNQSHQI